jgi:hypothetical protein
MIFGQVTLPGEVVGIVGAALAGGVAWQIRAVVDLKERIATLTAKLEMVLEHCPHCHTDNVTIKRR